MRCQYCKVYVVGPVQLESHMARRCPVLRGQVIDPHELMRRALQPGKYNAKVTHFIHDGMDTTMWLDIETRALAGEPLYDLVSFRAQPSPKSSTKLLGLHVPSNSS